ncbi:hypothetical protein Q8W15_01175 [Photobacterium damselae subsp. piscicida]|nr:hypothetical protein [Photobacterium damselae subsp. piscicida]MDP2556345.1 hypothetical protein [Photobacterium damselae subsp. piscicida]MDP2568346.1 hypothetical protein [Photobacterium damselae subsp. piscicida]
MTITTSYSTFRELVFHVQKEMLRGKTYTKSNLNKLIPSTMNKSADDIIRNLHELKEVKISYSHAKAEIPAFWYIDRYHRDEYFKSPERHKQALAQDGEATSLSRDVSYIQAITKRRGRGFIADIITSTARH